MDGHIRGKGGPTMVTKSPMTVYRGVTPTEKGRGLYIDRDKGWGIDIALKFFSIGHSPIG